MGPSAALWESAGVPTDSFPPHNVLATDPAAFSREGVIVGRLGQSSWTAPGGASAREGGPPREVLFDLSSDVRIRQRLCGGALANLPAAFSWGPSPSSRIRVADPRGRAKGSKAGFEQTA